MVEDPIRRTIEFIHAVNYKIHIMPFWKEYQFDDERIYLPDESLYTLIEKENILKEKHYSIITLQDIYNFILPHKNRP